MERSVCTSDLVIYFLHGGKTVENVNSLKKGRRLQSRSGPGPRDEQKGESIVRVTACAHRAGHPPWGQGKLPSPLLPICFNCPESRIIYGNLTWGGKQPGLCPSDHGWQTIGSTIPCSDSGVTVTGSPQLPVIFCSSREGVLLLVALASAQPVSCMTLAPRKRLPQLL